MINIKIFSSIIVIILITILSGLFVIQLSQEEIKKNSKFFNINQNNIKNLKYVKINKTGKLNYIINITEVKRCYNQHTLFYMISLLFYNENFYLKNINKNCKTLFNNDCYKKNINNNKITPIVKITTKIINLKKNKLTNKHLIIVKEPKTKNIITGIGLNANLKKKKFKILKKVRSHYVS